MGLVQKYGMAAATWLTAHGCAKSLTYLAYHQVPKMRSAAALPGLALAASVSCVSTACFLRYQWPKGKSPFLSGFKTFANTLAIDATFVSASYYLARRFEEQLTSLKPWMPLGLAGTSTAILLAAELFRFSQKTPANVSLNPGRTERVSKFTRNSLGRLNPGTPAVKVKKELIPSKVVCNTVTEHVHYWVSKEREDLTEEELERFLSDLSNKLIAKCSSYEEIRDFYLRVASDEEKTQVVLDLLNKIHDAREDKSDPVSIFQKLLLLELKESKKIINDQFIVPGKMSYDFYLLLFKGTDIKVISERDLKK